jgi:hypothetical protein
VCVCVCVCVCVYMIYYKTRLERRARTQLQPPSQLAGSVPRLQRQLRQYLYFCTSKASKLSHPCRQGPCCHLPAPPPPSRPLQYLLLLLLHLRVAAVALLCRGCAGVRQQRDPPLQQRLLLATTRSVVSGESFLVFRLLDAAPALLLSPRRLRR